MNDIKLSERLALIASLVRGGSAADIGTDHGFVPLFLMREGVCEKLILTDVNEGPLRKAEENIRLFGLDPALFDLRLGSGLSVLRPGETRTVIIAGMGGELIASILAEDLPKTRTFGRFVLQPRTRAGELRRWLDGNAFVITDERLARERGRICQVICASPKGAEDARGEDTEVFAAPSDYEYPPFLLSLRDPLAAEYIAREKARLKRQLQEVGKARSAASASAAEVRLTLLLDKLDSL